MSTNWIGGWFSKPNESTYDNSNESPKDEVLNLNENESQIQESEMDVQEVTSTEMIEEVKVEEIEDVKEIEKEEIPKEMVSSDGEHFDVVHRMEETMHHESSDTISIKFEEMLSSLTANVLSLQQMLNEVVIKSQQQSDLQQNALNALSDKVENVVEAQEITIQKQHNAALKFQDDVIYKTQKNLIMELIGIADNIRMIIQSAETEDDYDLLGAIRDLDTWVNATLANNSVRMYQDATMDPLTINRKRQQLVDKESTNIETEHNTYKTVSPGYEWSIPYLVVNTDVQLVKILEENNSPQLFSYVIRPEEIVKLEYKEIKKED